MTLHHITCLPCWSQSVSNRIDWIWLDLEIPRSCPGQDPAHSLCRFAACQRTALSALDGFLERATCWWDNLQKHGAITPPAAMAGSSARDELVFFRYQIWTHAHTICLNVSKIVWRLWSPWWCGRYNVIQTLEGGILSTSCNLGAWHDHGMTPQAILAGKPMEVDGHAMAHPLKRETPSLQWCKRERSHLCEMVSR